MKHSFFTTIAAVAAAITVFTSCEKSADLERPSSVQTSDAVGQIALEGTPNNLVVVSSNPQDLNVTLNTNLPCISYADNGYASGYGFSLERNGEMSATGRIDYRFTSGGNSGNTLDCTFFLIQSTWENSWVDYTRYGMIETPVVFRVRGEKGENIFPLTNPDSWKDNVTYYLKGVVTRISEISESAKDFETIGICRSMFANLDFTPAITKYTVESVVLSLETEAGAVDVQVFGKKRDGEILNLLEYINAGDKVEVPAVVSSKQDAMNNKFQPVRSASVLKID